MVRVSECADFLVSIKHRIVHHAVASLLLAVVQRLVRTLEEFRGGCDDVHARDCGDTDTHADMQFVASAAEFFQCADEALRHCKQQGRNGVEHYSMLDRNQKVSAL